jgi:hypothetical protein
VTPHLDAHAGSERVALGADERQAFLAGIEHGELGGTPTLEIVAVVKGNPAGQSLLRARRGNQGQRNDDRSCDCQGE